jgi:hypothetical protein
MTLIQVAERSLFRNFEMIALILLLQVVIQHGTVDHEVLIAYTHRVRLEPLLQAGGISVHTRNVRTFPSLRYPWHVVLAQKLAMHVYTWQVHLIALDWDYKLGRWLLTAVCIQRVFLGLIISLEEK